MASGFRGVVDGHERPVLAVSFATPQLRETHELICFVREFFGRKPILVAGGPHPTGDPRGTLGIGFDAAVRGEGEETFVELLRAIDRGDDYREVPGVASFNDNMDYQYTPRLGCVNLDHYPPLSFKHRRFGPIEITRGCACGCHFCQTPQIFGGKPRHRSVESICRTVERMVERNFRDFRFITPNALSYGSSDGRQVDEAAIEDLLKNLRAVVRDRGQVFYGTFPSEVRPEQVTPSVLLLIRKYADNDNLIVGAQSGSDRMLEHSHRGHTVEDIRRAVDMTIEAGFCANVDFIFGLPDESKEDRLDTLALMRDLAAKGARIHAHTFMPLPGTAFAKSPPGRIEPDIEKALADMLPTGAIYGQWEKQAEIARSISEYLQACPDD